ncbi:hypothetical protein WN51_06305 [Melipona quadrifasciata]|uniref:Uncharacterized protein n=1 Tax=Melipona quadrifasciata TaxID=166423 RepID=A0A0N0U3G5_9HYME|nr:hypothetical protein WN51_06305 [Melipona quadrifasciata]
MQQTLRTRDKVHAIFKIKLHIRQKLDGKRNFDIVKSSLDNKRNFRLYESSKIANYDKLDQAVYLMSHDGTVSDTFFKRTVYH